MSEQKLFKHFPIYTVKYKAKNVKIIALPIRDMNDSISHCKSQYIHGTQYTKPSMTN